MQFSKELLGVLSDGDVAVIPTDTIYGLVAAFDSKSGVDKVYSLKGRDFNKRCIVLISSPNDLFHFGVPSTYIDQAAALWADDRPTSIDLPVTFKDVANITRGEASLAFRLPRALPGLIEFLKVSGPIIAPSANTQGEPPAHTIQQAKRYFGQQVPVYMDAGLMQAEPSRVISIVNSEINIIRE